MINTHSKRILHLRLNPIRRWRSTSRLVQSLEHFEANKSTMEREALLSDRYESDLYFDRAVKARQSLMGNDRRNVQAETPGMVCDKCKMPLIVTFEKTNAQELTRSSCEKCGKTRVEVAER